MSTISTCTPNCMIYWSEFPRHFVLMLESERAYTGGFEDGMFLQRQPVHTRVNKAAASCAIFGMSSRGHARHFDIHRPTRRCSTFTSPMFTVHLADVHRSPRRCSQCTVHRVQSPYPTSREYTSPCLYSLLTVQHTTSHSDGGVG